MNELTSCSNGRSGERARSHAAWWGDRAAPTMLVSAPTSLSAALFDIDGTLFNSVALHFKVFQELLLEENYDGGRMIDDSFFKARISGRQNALICSDLFPGWTLEEGEAFASKKEARFREMAAAQLPALMTPGLRELLAQLDAAGVRCAAVTNAPRANAELMISAIGSVAGRTNALEFFEPLIIGDECVHAKPHPEPYLAACRAIDVDPERCVAFEDSVSGATAAVAAGVRTIGITSTHSPEELVKNAGCSLTIQDFEDEALAKELERWSCDP